MCWNVKVAEAGARSVSGRSSDFVAAHIKLTSIRDIRQSKAVPHVVGALG